MAMENVATVASKDARGNAAQLLVPIGEGPAADDSAGAASKDVRGHVEQPADSMEAASNDVGGDAGQPVESEVKAAPKKKFLQRNTGRGAAGTQMRSQNSSGKEAGLLPFLKGTGVDCKDRTLDEILEWDFDRMEKVHDYVQWLFPTDESSKYNMRAPLLTVKLQQDARHDHEVRNGIRRGLVKFCSFLGLDLLDVPPVQIQKAAHFSERAPVCWSGGMGGRGGNHNWLRISRVLHCLKLVGLDNEARALMECLEGLYSEGFGRSAIQHWRQRAATVPQGFQGLGGYGGSEISGI